MAAFAGFQEIKRLSATDRTFWDASFICRLYFRSDVLHERCRHFLYNKLSDAQNCTSSVAIQEAVHAVVLDGLAGRFPGKKWRDIDKIYKQTHDFDLKAESEAARHILQLVRDVKLTVLELRPGAEDLIPCIMRDSHIMTADAFHLATARQHGIPFFVTTDADFTRVTEDIQILCPAKWRPAAELAALNESRRQAAAVQEEESE